MAKPNQDLAAGLAALRAAYEAHAQERYQAHLAAQAQAVDTDEKSDHSDDQSEGDENSSSDHEVPFTLDQVNAIRNRHQPSDDEEEHEQNPADWDQEDWDQDWRDNGEWDGPVQAAPQDQFQLQGGMDMIPLSEMNEHSLRQMSGTTTSCRAIYYLDGEQVTVYESHAPYDLGVIQAAAANYAEILEMLVDHCYLIFTSDWVAT